jgi:2-polyprenyl-3-methyl-5-hydroxy-6-metoxy-1,4-benzoquinol methylase
MTDNSNPRKKLLVVIASFGSKQDKYMEVLVREYRKMSFSVDVVVVSNVDKAVPDGAELVVGMPTKDPWSLPFAHKKVMADRANDYDLFIYSENDTPISERNIEAFLRVSKELPANEIPGFLRYEDGPTGLRNYINLHGHYHWDSTSPVQRGPYTFAFLTNEHSACYLLTREQLRRSIDSGGFLVPPHHEKYDLACTASTDPYTSCGFRKLICISNLEDFLVHHLPDKYTGPEFKLSDQSFQQQLEVLMAIGANGKRPAILVQGETKLPAAMYSKDYDEPVRPEVVSEIPGSVRSILSLGSGTGKTERWLAEKGLKVTAAPLDRVIGACVEGNGIEVVYGDFAAVRKQLDGRKFDCLYLSNILHLVPDPQKILSQFADLLSPGGYILVVSPNVVNVRNQFNKLKGTNGYGALGTFEESGVQKVSKSTLKQWFRGAGLRLETMKWIPMSRFEKFSRHVPAALKNQLSTEVIALGRHD